MFIMLIRTEAATEVFYKKLYLQFPNFLRKTTVLESLFNKVAGLACNFLKKRLQSMCFPVKFAISLISLGLKNVCEGLFL